MGNSNSGGEEEAKRKSKEKPIDIESELEDLHSGADRKASLAYSSPDDDIGFKVGLDKAASSDSSFANIELESDNIDDQTDYDDEDDENDVTITDDNQIFDEDYDDNYHDNASINSDSIVKTKKKQQGINEPQIEANVKSKNKDKTEEYRSSLTRVNNSSTGVKYSSENKPSSSQQNFKKDSIHDDSNRSREKDVHNNRLLNQERISRNIASEDDGSSITEEHVEYSQYGDTSQSETASLSAQGITENEATESESETDSSDNTLMCDAQHANEKNELSEKDKDYVKLHEERGSFVRLSDKALAYTNADEETPRKVNTTKNQSEQKLHDMVNHRVNDYERYDIVESDYSKATSTSKSSISDETTNISDSDTIETSDVDSNSDSVTKRKDRHLSLSYINSFSKKQQHHHHLPKLKNQDEKKRAEITKDRFRKSESDRFDKDNMYSNRDLENTRSSSDLDDYSSLNSENLSLMDQESERHLDLNLNQGKKHGHLKHNKSNFAPKYNEGYSDPTEMPTKPPRRKKKHRNKSDSKSHKEETASKNIHSKVTSNKDSSVIHSHDKQTDSDVVHINTADKEINVKTSINIKNENTMQMGINIEIFPPSDLADRQRLGYTSVQDNVTNESESINFDSRSDLQKDDTYTSSVSAPKSSELDYDNDIMLGDLNAESNNNEVANALHDISKQFVSGCVESSQFNQAQIEHSRKRVNNNENSAYLGTLRQLSDESSSGHNSQNETETNVISNNNETVAIKGNNRMLTSSSSSNLSGVRSNNMESGGRNVPSTSGHALDLEHFTAVSTQEEDNKAMSQAYRQYLSFSSLVSGQTLGEEDEYKSLTKSHPPNLELLPDSAASSRNNSETDSPKLATKRSKKKNRSRKSRRLPPQAQEYWKEYLSKYNKMGLDECPDNENLRDITNIGSVKDLGSSNRDRGNITTFFSSSNSDQIEDNIKGNTNSDLTEDINNDFKNSSDYNKKKIKETGSTTSLESAKCKFTQRNQYVHNNNNNKKDLMQSCQSVCSKANVISHWSSNMNLHSESQLINDDSEIIKLSVDKNDISSDPITSTSTSSKNTFKQDEDDGEIEKRLLSLNKGTNSHTLVLESDRGESFIQEKVRDRSGVLNSFIGKSKGRTNYVDQESMVLINDSLIPSKKKQPVNLVDCEDILYTKHDINSSGSGLERTGSPSSVRRSLRNKPPSGANKSKKSFPVNESGYRKGKSGLIFHEEQAEKSGLLVQQQNAKIDPVKHIESNMLANLVSSNEVTMATNPEDGNFNNPSFSHSWSAPDFKQHQQVNVSSSGSANNRIEGVDMDHMEYDSRRNQGRRTISDLGFTYSRPGASRTAALLKNPIMRKHLARTMGLGSEASEDEIKDAIDDRLEVTMRKSNLSRSSSTMSLSSDGFTGMRGTYSRLSLQRTTSLSGGINTSMCDIPSVDALRESKDNKYPGKVAAWNDHQDTGKKSGDFCSRTNIVNEDCFENENRLQSDKVNERLDGNSRLTDHKTVMSEPVVLRRRAMSASSKFQIPSFNDFKKARKSGSLKMRPASVSFDYLANQTIPEEEHEERVTHFAKSRSMSFDTSASSLTDVTLTEGHSDISILQTQHDGNYEGNKTKDQRAFSKTELRHSDHNTKSSQQLSNMSKHQKTNHRHQKTTDEHKKTPDNHYISTHKHCDNNDDNEKLLIKQNSNHQQQTRTKTLAHNKSHCDNREDNNQNKPNIVKSRDSSARAISPDTAFSEELESVLLEPDSTSPEKFRDEVAKAMSLSPSKKKRKRDKKLYRKKLLDTEGVINRSTSDVSDIYAEEERKKLLKDKRQKPYKSDPFGKVHRKYLDQSVNLPTTNTITITLSDISEKTQDDQSQNTLVQGYDFISDSNFGLEGDEIKDELMNLVKDVQACSMQSLDSNLTVSSVPSVDSCLDEISDEDKPPPIPPRRRKSKRKKRFKTTGSSDSEVFRADSGVGAETFGLQKIEQDCEDCNTQITEENVEADQDGDILPVCHKCFKNRQERARIVHEILTSEQSYGKDLQIIYEEFYKPMQSNGLLNQDQLYNVFINIEELISINNHFVKQLQQLLETADNGKEHEKEKLEVHIGKLFLQATNMLLAFETYCIDHSEALVVLEALEKEREILRIFLEVSQAENSALRRMHLKAFLVIPVQRIMKYPLLLNRLYKVTPQKHPDRDSIKVAKRKIEDILEHINYILELKDKNSELSQAVQVLNYYLTYIKTNRKRRKKTKGTASMRLKKKFFVQQMLKNAAVYEDIEIHKVAMDTVGWSKNEVNIVYSGKILYSLMPDPNATKRGKMVKYSAVQGVLITLGKGPTWDSKHDPDSSVLFTAKYTEVKQCALVLLKEKGGSYIPCRETFYLDKCVVAIDEDIPEVFELQEMSRNSETFIVKSPDLRETTIWYNHLKFQCRTLGKWRKRRNAMPNIMITLGKS